MMTAAPPSSWTGPSTSPKATNAAATVIGGSSVERMLARPGPSRATPPRKAVSDSTVESSAMTAA
jgi:hypothetical protein